MTRAEHLAWCKERALAYVDAGDVQAAFQSMASDLQKHAGTAGHIGVGLGMRLLLGGQLGTREAMTKFINDFQ